jgi:beta-lactam-binding protein with PASTA domain/tetratricopeptide (TPR) repeat protein
MIGLKRSSLRIAALVMTTLLPGLCATVLAGTETPCPTVAAGRVRGIQVGSVNVRTVASDQISVKRRGISQSVQNGMPLCVGDNITVEQNDTLLLSLNRSVDLALYGLAAVELEGPSSVFLNIGKLFATLRGIFEARTSVATLAAKGTEFQVEVDGPHIDVLQLDGEVVVRPVETDARAIPAILSNVFLVSMQQPPAVPQTASSNALTLARLQHLELSRGDGAAPKISKAEESSVEKAEGVNAYAVLSARPSIPSQSLIPNFMSNEERDRAYRTARFQTVWSPEDRGYFQILGNVYVDWADPDRALRSYRSLEKTELADHDLAVDFVNTGNAYRMGGLAAAAEKLFARARELDPKFGPAYTGSGDVLFDQAQAAYDSGNVDKALALLNDAQEFYLKALDPSFRAQGDRQYRFVPSYHLGEIALSRAQWNPGPSADDVQQEMDLAMRRFKDALEVNPDYAFAHVGLGRAVATRSIKDSRSEYVFVLKNHPAFALASVAMGESYEQEGDWKTALQYFRQATQSDPDYPLAYYKTGLALQKLGDPLARNYFGVYLQIESPLFKGGGRTKRAIEAIAGIVPDGDTGPQPPAPMIPSVVGKTADEAGRQLDASGFRRGSVHSEQSEAVEKGLVIRQDPPAGAKVKPGQSVDLWLSAGVPQPPAPVIPSVTDLSLKEAVQQLQASGFQKGRLRSEHSDVPKDQVIRQDPPAGTTANPGQRVDLWLSTGPLKEVGVPNLIGMRTLEAVAVLAFSGLSITSQEVDSDQPRGKIVRQDPQAGARVMAQTAVTVYVSSGNSGNSENNNTNSDYVVVPNVTGLPSDRAKETIEAAGLLFNVSQKGHGNTVKTQAPLPGTSVRRGTRITVYVY